MASSSALRTVGTGLFGTHRRIRAGLTRPPFLHRGRADTVALGSRPHALLTSLDCPTDTLSRRGAAVENLSHSVSLHAGSVVPSHSGCQRALNAPHIGALNIPRFRDAAALLEPSPGRP